MRNIAILIGLFVFSLNLTGQNAADALLYSRTQVGGTARFVGVGGAFGALGADFSVLSTNPAGLAMYRTDEFMFTPSMKLSTINSKIKGSNLTFLDESNKFYIDNLGIVFNTTPRSSKWKTFNIGLGFNQLANFNQSVYYSDEAPGSIMNSFWEDVVASGFDETAFYQFGSDLAYQTNAIYGSNGDFSYDFVDNPSVVVNHTQTVNTKGKMNEMVFSFAGNYDEKIMLGGTLGFPFVNFERDAVYEEFDDQDSVLYFDGLSYTDYVKTDGIGMNAKIGLIYRLNQMVRLGAAIHSPTFLRLTDAYNTSFSYAYTDGAGTNRSEAKSPEGTSDYRLRTPWKAIFSGAALLGQKGFVSADIEVLDYSNNRYNFTADVNTTENAQYEQEVNRGITTAYGQAVNLRMGGEMVFDFLRLRGGLALLGQPGQGDTGFDKSYSAGLGLRGESAYVDLGYRFTRFKQTLSPYAVTENQLIVENNGKTSNLVLTVGVKF